jgi:hypothetical protein
MTQHRDASKLYGVLSVSAYDTITGKRTFHSVKKNQVTNNGRIVVLDLLAQLTPAAPYSAQMYPEYNQIWSLSIGDSPIPAAATDSALYSPQFSQLLSPVTERIKIEAAYEVRITSEVAAGDATDVVLTEAGLFTRGEQDEPDGGHPTWESILYRRMYARQTHPAFTKGATMRVVYEWTLGMTVSS